MGTIIGSGPDTKDGGVMGGMMKDSGMAAVVIGRRGVVRLWLMLGLLVLALAGEVAAQVPRAGTTAPEVTGGPWINSAPLSLAALRGRVVLVEFWTYG